jgi:copper chaperone CopZ
MGNGTTVISLGGEYDAARAVALEAAVARVDGVGHVEFNYTNNKVTVRFDTERTNLNEIKDLVTREKKSYTRSLARAKV